MIPAQFRPAPGDALLAAGFLALALIEGLTQGSGLYTAVFVMEGIAPYLLVIAPAMISLAWRRVHPASSAALVVLANMVTNVDGSGASTFAVVVSAYSLGAYSARRLTVLVLPTSLIIGLLMSAPGPEPMPNPSDLAAILIFLLAPWGIGRFVRDRAAESLAAQERADILEREHSALIAAAAAEERVRLARELHDVVTHSISVVCVQTQAVRHRLGPEHEAEARDLLSVETTAREAMTELRRLFGVLRGDAPAPLAPPPGLGHLDRLTASISATGVEVRVNSENLGQLPTGLDLTAYRIIQEALTNVVKHASASVVQVMVAQSGTGLDIRIDDDGTGLHTSVKGNGLAGIQERAELYGGAVLVGASPLGGVRVAAHFPAAAC